MRCVLHIGTEKTGTTMLQDWLYDNQQALGRQGIFLSDILGRTNNRLVPLYFQRSLDDWARTKGIRSKAEKDAYFEGFLDRFQEDVKTASASHHTFVISSEHLHSRLVSKEEIFELHQFLYRNFSDVLVICYFRNQFDAAVSLYSTALKNGFTETLEEFVDAASPSKYYFNILAIADQWSDIFGVDKCVFRIYDQKKFVASDLRRDFISVVAPSLDSAQLNYDLKTSNEALTPLQAAAFRAINKMVPYRKIDQPGINQKNVKLKKSILTIAELKAGKIRSAKRSEIEGRFEAINTTFFEKYFSTPNQFRTVTPDTLPEDRQNHETESLVEALVANLLK